VLDLRLPAAMVAGELVDEEDRLAAAVLFYVESAPIRGGAIRHLETCISL
jgi:hypothetical protein